MKRAVVTGIGASVPSRILTNQDLSQMVDTSDEWITQRTGIKERRISEPNESASTFAIQAANEALENAGLDPKSLDMIIVGTVTGDYPFPSTSCIVQEAIGAVNAGAFDVGAACAGFIYSLATASSMVESGLASKILVVGVDVLSKSVDYTDRSVCILFGDGAGAVVVEAQEDTDRGVLATVLLADGTGGPRICQEVGGSKYPYGTPQAEGHQHSMYMDGSAVYKFAVRAMADACIKAIEKAGITSNDIDLFVPHQANLRIIRSAQNDLNLSDDRVFVNVDKYGNTSAGSIPIALYEAVQSGKLKKGMTVLTVGFGAGLVWGANIIRW
jgi:3-oxoacyl-[acyl-carrier-protein] synthase-3